MGWKVSRYHTLCSIHSSVAHPLYRDTLLAVDSIVSILAGRPNGADDMEKTLEELEAAMSEAKTAGYGASSGEGQMVRCFDPCADGRCILTILQRRRMLRRSARNTRRVLNGLHGDPVAQRVAHFSNGKDIRSEMNSSLTTAYQPIFPCMRRSCTPIITTDSLIDATNSRRCIVTSSHTAFSLQFRASAVLSSR